MIARSIPVVLALSLLACGGKPEGLAGSWHLTSMVCNGQSATLKGYAMRLELDANESSLTIETATCTDTVAHYQAFETAAGVSLMAGPATVRTCAPSACSGMYTIETSTGAIPMVTSCKAATGGATLNYREVSPGVLEYQINDECLFRFGR